jgi:hypothetical protein
MKYLARITLLIATALAVVNPAFADLMLKQSTASQIVKFGPFVDSVDGNTEKTALTIANTDVKLSKNGGTIASKNSGGCTHDANGWYSCTLDATDTNTVGRLQAYVHVTGSLPVTQEFNVVVAAVYDELYGSSALGYIANAPVNVAQFGGTNGTFSAGVPAVNTTVLTDAAGVRTAVGLASANLDTQLSTIASYSDTEVAAIKAKTDNLPSAVAGAAGGVFIAGTNAATTVTTGLTANITGNLSGSVGSVTGAVGSVTGAVGSVTGNVGGNVVGSVASVTGNVGGNVVGTVASVTGAVGSVTGAVGSVTGNVGGNVTGSVGSVATGGITAASIATDAIGAAELASDAVTEIQTGLATTSGLGSVALTAASIDAIWDEAKSGHTTAGTYGFYLDSAISGVSTGGVSASTIADAVWDEVRVGHTTAGTFGLYLDQQVSTITGGSGLDAAATRAALGLATANLDTQLAALQSDTDNLQTRVPTALVSGRIDASVGAYQTSLSPLQPTVAGRTLDVSAGGEAGIDWANVGSPTTAVGLSGTTISTSQGIASVSGAVGSVTASVTVGTNGDKTGYQLSSGGLDAIPRHDRRGPGLALARLRTRCDRIECLRRCEHDRHCIDVQGCDRDRDSTDDGDGLSRQSQHHHHLPDLLTWDRFFPGGHFPSGLFPDGFFPDPGSGAPVFIDHRSTTWCSPKTWRSSLVTSQRCSRVQVSRSARLARCRRVSR